MNAKYEVKVTGDYASSSDTKLFETFVDAGFIEDIFYGKEININF